jgi:hypothetical protein
MNLREFLDVKIYKTMTYSLWTKVRREVKNDTEELLGQQSEVLK